MRERHVEGAVGRTLTIEWWVWVSECATLFSAAWVLAQINAALAERWEEDNPPRRRVSLHLLIGFSF